MDFDARWYNDCMRRPYVVPLICDNCFSHIRTSQQNAFSLTFDQLTKITTKMGVGSVTKERLWRMKSIGDARLYVDSLCTCCDEVSFKLFNDPAIACDIRIQSGISLQFAVARNRSRVFRKEDNVYVSSGFIETIGNIFTSFATTPSADVLKARAVDVKKDVLMNASDGYECPSVDISCFMIGDDHLLHKVVGVRIDTEGGPVCWSAILCHDITRAERMLSAIGSDEAPSNDWYLFASDTRAHCGSELSYMDFLAYTRLRLLSPTFPTLAEILSVDSTHPVRRESIRRMRAHAFAAQRAATTSKIVRILDAHDRSYREGASKEKLRQYEEDLRQMSSHQLVHTSVNEKGVVDDVSALVHQVYDQCHAVARAQCESAMLQLLQATA